MSPADVPGDALRARLDDGLARLGGPAAALDEDVRERLLRFVRLLEKWNRVHNLTAVHDAHDMIGRHLLDSLALLPWLPPPATMQGDVAGASRSDGTGGSGGPGTSVGTGGSSGPRESAASGGPSQRSGPGRSGESADDGSAPALVDLLDVGSGAGLPVLPLALVRSDLACLSVDAVGKKVTFQRQAVLELGLGNVEARHARIEDVAERARAVLSRAFAAPADFLAVAARHVAPGGVALVMLGRRERLPGTLPEPFSLGTIRALDVPFAEGERHVAVCHAP